MKITKITKMIENVGDTPSSVLRGGTNARTKNTVHIAKAAELNEMEGPEKNRPGLVIRFI